MVFILISIAIALLYVLGNCLWLKGIPQSISDTFYLLNNKKKGLGWLFSFFCWGVLIVLIPWFELTKFQDFQFLVFLAGAGLGFVGAAPHFKDDESNIHFWGAGVCIVSSQIWAFLTCWWIPLICWVAWIVGTSIYMSKHKTGILERTFIEAKPMFWIEITAFTAIYSTILMCYERVI